MSGPDSCATVKVVAKKVPGNDTGYVEINAEDFDAEVYTLYNPDAAPAKKPKADKAVAPVVEPVADVTPVEEPVAAVEPTAEELSAAAEVAAKAAAWGNT